MYTSLLRYEYLSKTIIGDISSLSTFWCPLPIFNYFSMFLNAGFPPLFLIFRANQVNLSFKAFRYGVLSRIMEQE